MTDQWTLVDGTGVCYVGDPTTIQIIKNQLDLGTRKPDDDHKGEYRIVEKGKWHLIDNDDHCIIPFTSEKNLRKWARDRQMVIKRSPTDLFGFYTVSVGYVPGNH